MLDGRRFRGAKNKRKDMAEYDFLAIKM